MLSLVRYAAEFKRSVLVLFFLILSTGVYFRLTESESTVINMGLCVFVFFLEVLRVILIYTM